jgi:hypothetical protein
MRLPSWHFTIEKYLFFYSSIFATKDCFVLEQGAKQLAFATKVS